MGDVNLSISKEVVAPIVEAKIKEAILSAMGGGDELIERVVHSILTKKVDKNGKVSSYNRENSFDWFDVVITKQIKETAEEAIKETLKENAKPIKEALIKQLQTKQGASKAAKALLDAMNGSFNSGWRSNIQINLEPITED